MFQYLLAANDVDAFGWLSQSSAVEVIDRSVCTIINGNILNIRQSIKRLELIPRTCCLVTINRRLWYI